MVIHIQERLWRDVVRIRGCALSCFGMCWYLQQELKSVIKDSAWVRLDLRKKENYIDELWCVYMRQNTQLFLF